MTAAVVAQVWASATHSFSTFTRAELRLIEGQGVAGDAHCGVTVKHRSRVAVDPTQPNLRQMRGVMIIVLAGGVVRPGDAIAVRLPPPPHVKLERV